VSKEKVSLMKSIEKNKKKLVGVNQEYDLMNAAEEAVIVMDVKQVDKFGKTDETNTKLENTNGDSLLSIQNLETKARKLEQKLDKVARHHKGLIN
jgi:hypothetical protein